MSENFIDRLARIHTLNPEDLFEGFYSLFSEIKKMGAEELIASKQAIDLGLSLSENVLTEKQRDILAGIVKAMQMRAYELIQCNRCNSATDRFLQILFYIQYRSGTMLAFHYDQALKKLKEIKPDPDSKKPQKKSWFGFFNKPRMHDPLDV